MQRAIRWTWAAGLVLAGALCLAGTAQAQRVEGDRARAQGLYQAEVPVNSQGESEREAGFARALSQVLAKLSGDRSAVSRPGVGQELRRASEYVDGYDYRQDEGISQATGAPSFSTTLIVRFDKDKVDDIASALGLPVWPQPRPKPVLWLAIDDGSGPRLVGLAKADAARSLLDRAIDRGYKLGLPAGNAAEQAIVGAIWRGDSAAVARLSARYQPPMQLIGKLYRHKGGWKADWIFIDKGRVLSEWSSDDRSARQAMAAGADGAADALMRKYAKRGPGAGPAGTYRVAFAGIHDAHDYMRLSAYLQRMSLVSRFTPVRATPDMLEADLELSTGVAGFSRLLDDDILVADADPGQDEVPGESGIPTFRLR